jgi:hypothetical protein
MHSGSIIVGAGVTSTGEIPRNFIVGGAGLTISLLIPQATVSGARGVAVIAAPGVMPKLSVDGGIAQVVGAGIEIA